MSIRAPALSVIWHDLECGGYTADLPVWRELATRYGDPILDVGAGTGRVALDLARHGHQVTALDQDRRLLSELEHRAQGLPVRTACADARSFQLEETFSLVLVPMQTIQLLGGRPGRQDFLRRAAGHLRPGAAVALAITERLERFGEDPRMPLPLPDIRELDGVVYSSQPTAVREGADGFILERLRERIGPAGERDSEDDVTALDRLSASQLEAEARAIGLSPRTATVVPETPDHVGSRVVILGA